MFVILLKLKGKKREECHPMDNANNRKTDFHQQPTSDLESTFTFK